MSAEKTSTTVEVHEALNDFSESSANLAKVLKGGADLTDMERLSLENNLALVQIHYGIWVRTKLIRN